MAFAEWTFCEAFRFHWQKILTEGSVVDEKEH